MGGVPVLPKADLHLHQEVWPRLDRLVASRQGRAPRDWSANADRVVADVPPGVARLGAIYRPDAELARELASAARPNTVSPSPRRRPPGLPGVDSRLPTH